VRIVREDEMTGKYFFFYPAVSLAKSKKIASSFIPLNIHFHCFAHFLYKGRIS